MAELVYNVSEAAEALGIARNTMYTLIHRKDFPATRIGGRWVISKRLLANWVDAQAQKGEA